VGGVKIAAVTTFNAMGKCLYGDRMMESFVRHWPEEVMLTAYAEGWTDAPEGIETIDLADASTWLSAFKARHRGNRFKDYRHDAVRFSHKIAAVCSADASSEADVLIWIDGDVLTHADVPLDALAALAPAGEEWIAWLDRDRSYPECGFFAINRRHERHAEMMRRLERMYREDELFALAEYHDSYVIEHVVKAAGVGAKSLSGKGKQTTHPLINGPLGAFLDHAKGQRKAAGRSNKRELVTARSEAHWR